MGQGGEKEEFLEANKSKVEKWFHFDFSVCVCHGRSLFVEEVEVVVFVTVVVGNARLCVLRTSLNHIVIYPPWCFTCVC